MLSFALNMTYYLKQKDEGEKIMKIYRQGAILALIAAAAVTGCGGKGNSQNAGQPVLQVNDYLVGEEEYDFFCSLIRRRPARISGRNMESTSPELRADGIRRISRVLQPGSI